MGDLSVSLPESTFAIALVAVALENGKPTFVTATEYPFDDLEQLGRASLPTALRRYASELDKDAPRVITVPAPYDDEEDLLPRDDVDQDDVNDTTTHTEKKD